MKLHVVSLSSSIELNLKLNITMFATTKSSTLSPLFSFSRTTTSVPSKPKFWNLVPMNQSSSPGHLALALDNPRRTLHVSCGSTSPHASQRSSIQVPFYLFDFIYSILEFLVTCSNSFWTQNSAMFVVLNVIIWCTPPEDLIYCWIKDHFGPECARPNYRTFLQIEWLNQNFVLSRLNCYQFTR